MLYGFLFSYLNSLQLSLRCGSLAQSESESSTWGNFMLLIALELAVLRLELLLLRLQRLML